MPSRSFAMAKISSLPMEDQSAGRVKRIKEEIKESRKPVLGMGLGKYIPTTVMSKLYNAITSCATLQLRVTTWYTRGTRLAETLPQVPDKIIRVLQALVIYFIIIIFLLRLMHQVLFHSYYILGRVALSYFWVTFEP